ncbi:MAG: recombinase family protein [Magnetococcales bacterium]|nr:recombinase family protein [Magnetococcales bacterium]
MNIKKPETPKVRCAIYTRKSTDEGLDMEFNSLDAQRESCEAYIASQKSEGWFLVADRYDDGGFSGGSLERPALKRLMIDIEAGKINVVVVYKLDRLTRSLMDFSKMVEAFDRRNVTFVSVTQSFNTTTSMGRLTLNILLSFAQFEREIAAERIRDKFAASKRRGIWMGGHLPLGYDVRDRKLLIVPEEAKTVRFIFQRIVESGSVTQMVKELAEAGATGKNGSLMDKGYIYRILSNRLYLGEITMGEEAFPGEHEAIIDRETWDKVHQLMASNTRRQVSSSRVQSEAVLKGIVRCHSCDRAMSPSFTRKNGGRLYRYYTCQNARKNGHEFCNLKSVPAGEIEAMVVGQVRTMLKSPEMIVKTWQSADGIDERDVGEALRRLDPVWEELFPVEQHRLIMLLISKVDVERSGVKVHLRAEGLDTLARELTALWTKKEKMA